MIIFLPCIYVWIISRMGAGTLLELLLLGQGVLSQAFQMCFPELQNMSLGYQVLWRGTRFQESELFIEAVQIYL